MSSLIGIFALGALSLVIVLLPLWQRRSDRSLGSGIETDDIALQWEMEKDRLVKEQHDLDLAFAEGKLSPEVHEVEREQVVADAQRALERLRKARKMNEKIASQARHKPRVYPKYGAALGSLILIAAMALTLHLNGQDIQRVAAPAAGKGQPQIKMADIEKMVAGLEAKVKSGDGNNRDKMMLARSYLVLGRRDEALALYETLLKDDEKNIPAMMALGEIYFNSKNKADWGKSLAYFEKALQVQPDKPEALWYKSLGLVRQRKITEARVVLVHLQEVSKDNKQAQDAVAQLLAELDKNRAPAAKPETPNN
ncbi:MAG: hypothetical protein DHS20C08_14500 [Rhodomicrobium sp.]|nr:MAG: hypothetical protein DHS20C08_14500 [Rhodomicrobium sp.]